MSAETLRKAASQMRERAEAAPEQPRTDADVVGVWLNSRHHLTILPAVALAVADLLSMSADHAASSGAPCGSCVDQAFTVARIYLGESA